MATSRTSASRPRRVRITAVDAWAVTAISLGAGVAAAFAGAHPTAWSPADIALTAAFAAFVSWCGASAPWWVLAGGSGVAALTASDPAWTSIAIAGFVIAAFVGAKRRSWPAARAVAAGLAINTLLHWGSDGFHGLTAMVTGAVAAAIVIGGLRRRRHSVRRTAYRSLTGVAIVAGVVVVGGAIGVALAYGDLRDGEKALRAAAAAISDGDITLATEQLQLSQQRLGAASDSLHQPWARAALAVPILGQHLDVAADLASDLEALSGPLSVTATQIDVDSLRVEDGVIDLDAVELLGKPLADTEAALTDASESLVEGDSAWLVAPLADRIDSVGGEVDGLLSEIRTARTAVELIPSMLGRDEPRTYFVAFTTPAESRGLGGFMGTWAELRADDGRLDVTRTGQTSELTSAMDPDPVLTGPEDYLARYGRFGAGENGQPVAPDFWSNVTMSPDFPSITEVFAQLYPASGGSQIDGAIAIDVETVARFLDLTGPIDVTGPDGPIRINSGNAEDYLLRGQYATFDDDDVRDAVLEELTSRLIDTVFGGSLPGPTVLAHTLGPAMDESRLVVWSRHAEDQPLLEELGIDGGLPTITSDGFAVVSNNAGANKLDAYLNRSIAYEAVVNELTGEISATATVRLTNTAPDDLPVDAGGNPFGLPPGTNRMFLSIYSPWELTSVELDGEPTGMEPSTELGWRVYSRFVDIPAGGEVVLQFGFEGVLPVGEPYELVLRSQPLALPDAVSVDVRTSDGDILHSSNQERVGVDRLDGSGDDEARGAAD